MLRGPISTEILRAAGPDLHEILPAARPDLHEILPAARPTIGLDLAELLPAGFAYSRRCR